MYMRNVFITPISHGCFLFSGVNQVPKNILCLDTLKIMLGGSPPPLLMHTHIRTIAISHTKRVYTQIHAILSIFCLHSCVSLLCDQKCEGFLPPEWRKFSVDPQITSLEVLFSILAKAFDLSADFTISYRSLEPTGTEQYAAVLSDWDLDAAFLRAHNLSVASATEPCLNLRIDIKPFSEAPDWDVAAASQPSPCANSAATAAPQLAAQTPVVSSGTASASIGATGQKYVHTMQARLPGLIMNQVSNGADPRYF